LGSFDSAERLFFLFIAAGVFGIGAVLWWHWRERQWVATNARFGSKQILIIARSRGTRSDNIYQFKHTIWINILMTQLKKKNAQNHANVRKHCLFRSNEISLINEAMAKAKVSFSHFVRRSAIRSAEAIAGRRIPSLWASNFNLLD
jgi:hypothetical protein